MVPSAKKTKQLLIATRKKLQNVNQLTLDLYVNGVTEGFSTFERFEHSTGTRRFNSWLNGGQKN